MADEPRISIPVGNSEPPQVKVIAARGAALQMVIAQFSEFFGLLVIGYALVAGKLSEQTFAYLFVTCLSGRFAQQVGSAIRGKPVPTTAPTVVTGIGGLAVALTVLLQGCAGSQLHEPDWAQVRRDANEMRTAVNEAVDDARSLVPMVDVVCAFRGDTSKECVALHDGYDIAHSAVETARKAIDLYDSTGAAGEQVHVAVARVKALAGEFADAAQAALMEVQHVVGDQVARPGSGGAEPVPSQESRPGAAEGTRPQDAAAPANAAGVSP